MNLAMAKMLARPRLGGLSSNGMRLVLATRLRVVCARRGVAALPLIAQRLGCKRQALSALHIVEVIGAVWPEKFALSPPCCGMLSHDEALLGALAEAAEEGERAAFDAHARDLLNEDARERLWGELRAFAHPVRQHGR